MTLPKPPEAEKKDIIVARKSGKISVQRETNTTIENSNAKKIKKSPARAGKRDLPINGNSKKPNRVRKIPIITARFNPILSAKRAVSNSPKNSAIPITLTPNPRAIILNPKYSSNQTPYTTKRLSIAMPINKPKDKAPKAARF
jgi:hypothetical protein